jgi:hypothetical protein
MHMSVYLCRATLSLATYQLVISRKLDIDIDIMSCHKGAVQLIWYLR